MSTVRHCVAMTLGVIALGLFLVAIGIPPGVVFAFAPVAICLSMVLLMGRGDRVEDGLSRYRASSETSGQHRQDTPGEYTAIDPKLAG